MPAAQVVETAQWTGCFLRRWTRCSPPETSGRRASLQRGRVDEAMTRLARLAALPLHGPLEAPYVRTMVILLAV